MASLKVLVSQLVLCVLLGVTGTYGKPPNAIVGGFPAAENEFPYQVSLRYNGQHICGGSIIDTTHILTAAHCVADGDQLIYTMTVVTSSNSLSSGGRHHSIKRITTHPGYLPYPQASWKNDLAVITLNKAITLDSRTQTVRLPTSNVNGGVTAVASGWGYLYADGFSPDGLRKLHMSLLNPSQCNLPGVGPITSTHLCAFRGAGSGVCSGDSGGPLVYNGELVGVTSFVIPCGKGYPDVFTRVYSYVNWIKQVIRSS